MKVFVLCTVIALVAGCGNPPSSVVEHKKVAVATNPKSETYYQYLMGEMATHRGSYKESIAHFEQAQHQSDSIAIDYRIAVEHAMHLHFVEALAAIKDVLTREPNHFHAKLLRAKIYATEGNYADSKQDFDDVLAHPKMQALPQEKMRAQLSLITLQIEAKDYQAAYKLLATMQKEDPANELPYYYMARIATEEGDLKKAQRLFEKTVTINDRFVLAHRALVLMYEYHDQAKKKIATLEKIMTLEPADIQIRTQLIRLYLEKGQLQEAKRHEEYFGNRFEQNVNFCYQLGLFYVQQKMFASGNEVFSACAKQYPENDQIAYYYGLSLFYTGQQKKSLSMFSVVKPASSFYEKAILAQASILRNLLTHQEIVDVFEKGIRHKPASAEIRLHYARYQFEQQNSDQAKAILHKAIRKFSQEEPLFLLLAEIYEKEKSYQEMEVVLRKLLKQNPSSASALNFLGYSYADQGIKLDEAEQMVVKALEIKPSDGYIQDSLSWVYYKQKKYTKALQVIEAALQSVSNEHVLWSHYGDILFKLGRVKQALQAYQKALEFSKEADDKKKIQQKIDLHTAR